MQQRVAAVTDVNRKAHDISFNDDNFSNSTSILIQCDTPHEFQLNMTIYSHQDQFIVTKKNVFSAFILHTEMIDNFRSLMSEAYRNKQH